MNNHEYGYEVDIHINEDSNMKC